MGFKRIDYDSGENFVEIKIKEGRDKIIDSWVVMMSDLPKWFNLIRRKYGLKSRETPKELDWAV